ncbi:MAG: YciI family protein [Actinomycetota bacterium]
MKYLLQIWSDEGSSGESAPEAIAGMFEEYGKLTDEMRAEGVFLGGEGLQPTSTATSVRVREGDVSVIDGPFAETKEQLGGFFLIECADLDGAIAWAGKIPGARGGTIEIRPVAEYEPRRA